MTKQQTQLDEEAELQRYERELVAREQSMMGTQLPYSSAMFQSNSKGNLVEWQLDFRNELEDIERLLKCDIVVRDKEGNEYWTNNPNQGAIFMNSLGVSDCIRTIRTFLNKNMVLSNYALDEVKPRVRMLGHELRSLIYNNYEAYGIDNEYKMNNYPIIILSIMSMIESAYRRAINGEERKDLNQARVVNQNDNMMPQNMNFYPQQQQNKKGFLAKMMPWSWGSRN